MQSFPKIIEVVWLHEKNYLGQKESFVSSQWSTSWTYKSGGMNLWGHVPVLYRELYLFQVDFMRNDRILLYIYVILPDNGCFPSLDFQKFIKVQFLLKYKHILLHFFPGRRFFILCSYYIFLCTTNLQAMQ